MERRIIEQAVAQLGREGVFYQEEKDIDHDYNVATIAVIFNDAAGRQSQAFLDAIKAGIEASESPVKERPLIVRYGDGIAVAWNVLETSFFCPMLSGNIDYCIDLTINIGKAASAGLSGRARKAGGGDMFQVPLPGPYPSPASDGISIENDLNKYIYPGQIIALADAMKGKEKGVTLPYMEDVFTPDCDDADDGEVLLNCGGEPFIRAHDLALVYAPRKGGKSTLSMALAASCLGASVLRFERPESVQPLRVLIADTEQQAADLKGEIELLAQLSGKDWRALDIVTLKLVSRTPKERRERIEAALMHVQPDIAIIDVVSDLLLSHNINDEKDSAELAELIKRWAAAESGPAIVCAIHNNGGSGAADRPRGHLGTELENKAEHLIRLSARQDGTRTLTFTERRKPLEPFSYIRDDGGLHLIEQTEMRKRAANRGPTFWRDHLEPGRNYRRAELETILREWNPDISDKHITSLLSDESRNGLLHKLNADSYELP